MDFKNETILAIGEKKIKEYFFFLMLAKSAGLNAKKM